ncbi:hypothetical protein WG904_10875 [Pedobacter sp. Du54]|uniref:hypothetical protein n=1 Tax=Pedobacter anseongensis TaxID=3133439 RepID=UPI00309A90E2
MKKLMYTIALVVLGITSSNAQEPSKRKVEGREGKERIEGRERFERQDKLTAEQRAEKAATAMQKKLALTDEQKQKVLAIELDRAKKNEEWRKQDDKTMKNKMEERKAFMTASKEKMDKILTEEQRKTLASAREDVKNRVRENRGKRPGRPGDKTPPPPPVKN